MFSPIFRVFRIAENLPLYFIPLLPKDPYNLCHQRIFYTSSLSGEARTFPGGRVAHPEGQNEEENK